MARTNFLRIAAPLFGLLSGCSTADSRIKGDPTTFAALSPAGGFYGIYPYDPYPDVISYEVPYKTVFFENGRCAAWEIIH